MGIHRGAAHDHTALAIYVQDQDTTLCRLGTPSRKAATPLSALSVLACSPALAYTKVEP